MGFDFDRMTRAFEKIHRNYSTATLDPQRPLPNTNLFLHAMGEVLSLFETLGSAFTFVKRDIEKKLAIIAQYQADDESHFADLNDAVEYELSRTGLLTTKEWDDGYPTLSRTLLRLMWALKFADRLLEGLDRAFDSKSDLADYDRTLKWAVSRAYDDALAEHHSWGIRKSVKSACMLLPSKESFLKRVGVDVKDREALMKRLGGSMSPLVDRMYQYYEERNMLGLP